MKKFLTVLMSVMIFAAVCAGCGSQDQKKEEPSAAPSASAEAKGDATSAPAEDLYADPICFTIEMEDGGVMKGELYPKLAPATVDNFVKLAKEGFYDGLIFHRVISGFMIQGGCPQGTGMGGPGYCIKGEFKLNGVKNNLSHKRGVLSMARAQSPNSAGSQFFIMHEDGEFLDGQYAAFGKVLEGMDVVDKIAAVKTDGSDRPLSEQKIASIRVDTKGEEYPEPDKLRDPYGRF